MAYERKIPMTTTTIETPTGFDPALRRMALVVALGAIMTILDSTIVNVAINTLGKDFDTSLSTIQWVITAYILALSMTIPITRWVVERFGAKTMWLTSLTLFIAGSVLCGAAWSAPSLIAFRVLQGIGGGLLMPVGQSMLAREAGPERMGRAMAVIAVPGMLAPVLGPVLGGVILDHLSWRWMFYINVPFCALALVLAVRLLPRDQDRRVDSRLDAVGLALLSPGLAALVYGLSRTGESSGVTGAGALTGLVAGAALTAGASARCWTCACSGTAPSRRPAARCSSTRPRSSACSCWLRSTTRS
jgi:EmrB/QacA subfamily drug resistance transporter